ncbi:prolyl oligopeptidase family serine peptidase [Bosea sp. 124]|uniref:alpha/beta hydrolase family protein n=1 Tax=Bosea sp. 124 TaxID=2135642 RepID=UPI000D37FD30|nr:prolyl oligopeptidase family serine peptidase [Bosea sp. 124]PTM39466.1 prolyl oligopeptidase family protein [Bosea sp. 124]
MLLLRLIGFLASFLGLLSVSIAQPSGPVPVASGVTYELIARWDADKLNRILSTDTPAFFGIPVSYTPARNAVKLYRVTYSSVVPERGNRPIATSGLVAVPDTAETDFPLVSYQHGTVYGKEQVPSFPDQSAETQLMVAQFAGQGYVLIGADYFGMGASKEPEGYLVKASHQQATADMVVAGRAVLADLKLKDTKLFLAGWSQGGYVTMAMLEKLEADGVPVKAAVTASAPSDAFAAFYGFLGFPRKIDAAWIPTIFILAAFSYENYYGVPGLAKALLTEDTYENARKAYLREQFDAAAIPTDLRKLIKPDYFDARFFTESAFGKLFAKNHAYRWVVTTPVRNYYGLTDEAIRIEIGRLPMTWQQALGNVGKVEAVPTGDTSHRGTFAAAVPQWKSWFDAQ